MIEREDAYIWSAGTGPEFITGFTKAHLPGDTGPDIKKALAFTGADLGVGYMKQRHGAAVLEIDSPGRYISDGIFTRSSGLALVVRTADCLPLVFYSSREKAVGAVHMGWRSARAGIIEHIGFDLTSFSCIAGVGMRKCCYKVGMEFLDYGPLAPFIEKREGALYFDPVTFARSNLISRGLRAENFFDHGECSFCSERGFHSYRRTNTGYRTLSFAARRA